jgi:chaperonin GroEL (HSP60 family)
MERYDKVVDALNSVQTAKKKGVVAGAGLTYWNLADLLDAYSGEYEVGVKVLSEALRVPRKKLYQTLEPNALKSEGWSCYNLKTGKF